jgi:hypothetical protein
LYNEKSVKADIKAAGDAWKAGEYFDSGKYYGEVLLLVLPSK